MKALPFLLLFALSTSLALCQSNDSTHTELIKAYQEKMNREFSEAETSPLRDEDREKFQGLSFFPIDSTYRVEAQIVRTPKAKPFRMNTTTDRKPVYRQYAEAYFSLKGQRDTLYIYQNLRLTKSKAYENYLFLPFTDLTNGLESYGGGRYLDLRMPEGDTIILDFNKAYNPYCAYNYKYSCPIPPRKNHLEIKVKAGVKHFEHP